jgi:hypothetical protein
VIGGYLTSLLGVIAGSKRAPEPPSFVNFSQVSIGSNVTSATTPAVNVASGLNVFVFVEWDDVAISGVSDNAGNTFVPLSTNTQSFSDSGKWYYCLNANGSAAHAVTATLQSADTISVGVLYLSSGTLTFLQEANANSGSGASSPLVSASFSATGPSVAIVGTGVVGSVASITLSDSMEQRYLEAPGPLYTGKVGFLVGPSGFSGKTVSATFATGRSSVINVAVFNYG